MPNALVEHYRRYNPDSPESDDDITLKFIEDGGLERALKYPGVADDWKRIELRTRKENAPSYFGEFSRAFGSGVDRTQAQLYDTAALAGDLVGLPAVTRWGQEGYDRNIQEAAEAAPTIRSLDEISGVGDALRYGTALAGSQAPQLALTAGAAALGGVAGGLVGGPAGAVAGATETAEAMLARQAAMRAAVALGQKIGGGVAGFTQMQNRGALLEQPGVDQSSVSGTAITTGVLGGALEMLPVAHFLGKIQGNASHLVPSLIPAKVLTPLTRHLPDGAFGEYLGRVLQNVPEQAILEGGTEALQEVVTMAGETYANRDNPQFHLTPDQIKRRLLESGVAGAVLGFGSGGIESIPAHPTPGQPGAGRTGRTQQQEQGLPPPVDDEAAAARAAANSIATQDFYAATRAAEAAAKQQAALSGGLPGVRPDLFPSPEIQPQILETAAEAAAKAREAAGKVGADVASTVAEELVGGDDDAVKRARRAQAGQTGQTGAGTGIPLADIPWSAKADWGTGKIEERTGVSKVVNFTGRMIALGNVNGVQVPFYLSTGKAGKKNVKAGKWYPFFGLAEDDGWINKGSQEEINNYYGNADLRRVAEQLDAEIGDIRDDTSVPRVGTIGPQTAVINHGMTPAKNETSTSRADVKRNIEQVLARIQAGAQQTAPTTGVGPLGTAPEGSGGNRPSEGGQVAQEPATSVTASPAAPALEPLTPELDEAYQLFVSENRASKTVLRKRFGMSALKADKIIDQLEELGYIGPLQKDGSRTITVQTPAATTTVTRKPKDVVAQREARIAADKIASDQASETTASMAAEEQAFGIEDKEAERERKENEAKAAKARELSTEVDKALEETAPGKKAAAPAKTAPAKEPAAPGPMQGLNLEFVDFKSRPLTAETTKRGTAAALTKEQKEAKAELVRGMTKNVQERKKKMEAKGEKVTKEWEAEMAEEIERMASESVQAEADETEQGRVSQKAFYLFEGDEGLKKADETDDEYLTRIGEALVSDAGGGGSNKSDTRRIAFFEKQDGEGHVVGYPIWYKSDSKKAGGKKLYRIAGTTLDKFLAQGHVPVASFRTNVDVSATDKNNVFRYPGYKEFQQDLVNPAIQKQRDAAEVVAAAESKMQAQAVDSEGNKIEKAAAPGLGGATDNPLLIFQNAVFEELGGKTGIRKLVTGSEKVKQIGQEEIQKSGARVLDKVRKVVSKLAEDEPEAYLAAVNKVLQNKEIAGILWGQEQAQAKSTIKEVISQAIYGAISDQLTERASTGVASGEQDNGQSAEGRGLLQPATVPGTGGKEGGKVQAVRSGPESKERPAAKDLTKEEIEKKAAETKAANEAAAAEARAKREAEREKELAEQAAAVKPTTPEEKDLIRRYVEWLNREFPDDKVVMNPDEGTVTFTEGEEETTSTFSELLGTAKGAEKRGALTPSSDPDELSSLPDEAKEPGRASTGDIQRRMNLVQSNAERNGVTVDVLKAVNKETGKYNNKKRKITLALHDAENPTAENLRLLLHEIAHDVSAALPDNIRTAVHQAISGSTDKELRIEHSTDPRIREENPNGLREPILTEERLAERLAIKGVNEELSRSIAAQIVRLVKELFYDVAMALQKVYRRTPNPALAKAYVENRFNRVIAGDRVSQARKGSGNKKFLGSNVIQAKSKVPLSQEKLDALKADAKIWLQTEKGKRTNFPTKTTFLEAVNEIRGDLADNEKALLGELEKAFRQFGINPKLSLHGWLQDPYDGSITRGDFNPDTDTIRMSRVANQLTRKFSKTLFHEALHAATARSIQYAEDYKKGKTSAPGYTELPPDVEERVLAGVEKLNEVYEQVKATGRNLGHYGMSNLDEFVSEAFTSKAFQTFLAGIPSKQPGMKNLFQEFLSILKEMLGLEKLGFSERSTLDDIIETAGSIFEGKESFEDNWDDDEGPRTLSQMLIPPTNSKAHSDGEELYSLPGGSTNRIGEQTNPQVIAETAIAALNERKDFESNVATELLKVPSFVSVAATKKIQPIELFRKMMRFDDPAEKITEEMKRTDPATGLPLSPRGNVKIGSFKATENNQLAAQDALQEIYKQHDKVQQKVHEFEMDARKFKTKWEDAAKAHQEAVNAGNMKAAMIHEASALAHKATYEEATTNAAAASAVVGLYKQKQDELMGPLGAHKPFFFGQDAEIDIPQTADATVANGGFRPMTIKLDRGSINPKLKSQLQEASEKMSDWLANPKHPRDGTYYKIKQMQRELEINGKIDPAVRETDNLISGVFTGAMPEMLKSLGTPLARLAGQMINRLTDQQKLLKSMLLPMAEEADRFKHAAHNALGVGAPEFYMHNFYGPAIDFLESRRDIVEQHPNSFKKQMDVAMDLLRKRFEKDRTIWPLIQGNQNKFMTALRKHVEKAWEISDFIRKHTAEAGNIEVRDKKLGGMERQHVQRGIVTLPRRFSATFDSVFETLREAGWGGFAETIKDGNIAGEYNQLGASQVRAQIAPFWQNQKVQEDFLRPLVHNTGTHSIFDAPRTAGGTAHEANLSFVRQAFDESGGDVVKFFEKLYEKHGGTTDKGEYIQEGLETLARVFQQIRHMREEVDPDGMGGTKTLRNMIPGLMINGREISHLPAQWFEHMDFNRHTINRVIDRVAAQSAFGHQNERLDKAMSDVEKEYEAEMRRLKDANTWVLNTNLSTDPKVVEAALAKHVGSMAELKRLKRLQALGSRLIEGNGGKSIKQHLIEYFTTHGSNQPGTFANTALDLFTSLMVNQPGTAIGQLAETGSPLITMGPSKSAFKMVGRNIAGTGKELLKSIGMDLNKNNHWDQQAKEMGVTDYEARTKLSDIRNEPSHPDESSLVTFMRKAQAILGLSVGNAGFRPGAVFKQVNIGIHIAGTISTWKHVDEMVRKGIEWAKANPAEFKVALADETPREWAGRLGMSGAEKDGFAKFFQHALDDWGVDFYSLIQEGMKNEKSGKNLLSEITKSRLQGMFIKETVSEANPATMSPAAESNPVIKPMSKLLNWSWRRARQVAGLRLDEKDELSYRALSRNLMGLAVLGGGGLAVSALVDFYNEELQNKRRNLRRLTPNQDFSTFLRAVLEHSARVGTLGGWGEAANALVGGVTGTGDNRGISIDQRTVAISSIMGMFKAVNALINQHGDADYMNVIRPMLFSMGGNGALQYLQIANHMFDLDNVESRAVARTNVGNWLRVMGRELGMDVASDQRGYSAPNPLTPHITRMQMAAFADDRSDFMAARRAAIEKARETHPDAEEYVARTYASRNPLKSIFKTPPTEREYRELLSAMPESGRADVTEAINLFNRYGASMGLQPFDGKPVKAAKASGKSPFGSLGGGSFGSDPFRAARDRATAF